MKTFHFYLGFLLFLICAYALANRRQWQSTGWVLPGKSIGSILLHGGPIALAIICFTFPEWLRGLYTRHGATKGDDGGCRAVFVAGYCLLAAAIALHFRHF